MSHVTHIKKNCHRLPGLERVHVLLQEQCHAHECVVKHTGMHHVTHVKGPLATNSRYHTCKHSPTDITLANTAHSIDGCPHHKNYIMSHMQAMLATTCKSSSACTRCCKSFLRRSNTATCDMTRSRAFRERSAFVWYAKIYMNVCVRVCVCVCVCAYMYAYMFGKYMWIYVRVYIFVF